MFKVFDNFNGVRLYSVIGTVTTVSRKKKSAFQLFGKFHRKIATLKLN